MQDKLEKKIDDLANEMKIFHHDLISLRTEVKMYSSVNAKHDTDIELLKSEILAQKGVIGLFKIIGVVLLSSFIGFGSWITNGVFENQKQTEKNQKSIEHIEKDVVILEQKILAK